jgi:SAM-dependent methyltransferase
MARASTKAHWDAYWKENTDPHVTYDNDDRVINAILALGDVRGKRILEVGAGSGRDSIELARRGALVTVIDYVPSSLDVVARNAAAAGVGISMVCADGTRMPFDEGTFDVVFHQGLLEHFRDPIPLVADNRRVLKPGGHVVIDVPQRWHVYTVGKKIMIALDRWFAGWETEFSIRELSRLVEAQGFRVVARFGDWMIPGFFYRAARYGLRAVGVEIPRNPGRLGPVGRMNDAWRDWFRRRPLAYWTFAMIGVVGKKV